MYGGVGQSQGASSRLYFEALYCNMLPEAIINIIQKSRCIVERILCFIWDGKDGRVAGGGGNRGKSQCASKFRRRSKGARNR